MIITGSRFFCKPHEIQGIPHDAVTIAACLEIAYRLTEVEDKMLDASCCLFQTM